MAAQKESQIFAFIQSSGFMSISFADNQNLSSINILLELD